MVEDDVAAVATVVNLCSSEKKIMSTSTDNSDGDELNVDNDVNSGYLFMDIGVLFPVLNELVKCPRCGYSVESILLIDGRQGLANPIKISCRSLSCKWDFIFYSSSLVGGEISRRGPKPFDVNIRSQIAFREIGRGHDAIETFCGYMNMPPPSNKAGFSNITDKLSPAYQEVVQDNMKEAAREIRNQTFTDGVVVTNELEIVERETDVDSSMLADDVDFILNSDDAVDTAVSVDGSWQRRGYASLNGLVTAISIDSGKCLSYECLIKKCKSCQMWEAKKVQDRAGYEKYQRTHECPVNHEGSAASMETEGALKIFQKSVVELNLYFTTYIGDGDSKAYPAVSRAEPYGPEKPVIKGECIGHVQKRVCTRLRKYKKEILKKS